MKTWTVVIEVHDDSETPCTKEQIESVIVNPCPPFAIAYQVMETIEAPYGPAGVHIETDRRLKPFRNYPSIPRENKKPETVFTPSSKNAWLCEHCGTSLSRHTAVFSICPTVKP